MGILAAEVAAASFVGVEVARLTAASVAAMARDAARAVAAAIFGAVERDQVVALARAVRWAAAGAPWARVRAEWMVAAGACFEAVRKVVARTDGGGG